MLVSMIVGNMINPKIKATARFIKELRGILNNWERYTGSNTGIYTNKIRYCTANGIHVWTKSEVIDIIKKNKEYIKKELNK